MKKRTSFYLTDANMVKEVEVTKHAIMRMIVAACATVHINILSRPVMQTPPPCT